MKILKNLMKKLISYLNKCEELGKKGRSCTGGVKREKEDAEKREPKRDVKKEKQKNAEKKELNAAANYNINNHNIIIFLLRYKATCSHAPIVNTPYNIL